MAIYTHNLVAVVMVAVAHGLKTAEGMHGLAWFEEDGMICAEQLT